MSASSCGRENAKTKSVALLAALTGLAQPALAYLVCVVSSDKAPAFQEAADSAKYLQIVGHGCVEERKCHFLNLLHERFLRLKGCPNFQR